MAGKMASRKKKEKAFNVLAFFIVLILAALVLLPIWWIFRSSLMSTAALNEYPPSFIPHEWLWSNYSKALETFEYWTYFKNTFTIIIPAVTFGTITAIFCGYAFARLRFRGKKLIFNICVGTILLPGMVTLIPLYIFWTKGMGLGDTYWPLILPFLTGGGQEKDLRSTTENVAGIASMAKALRLVTDKEEFSLPKIAKMKKIIFDELAKYEDITIFSGEGEDFAPNILTFGIKGVRGEVVVHAFEEHQIYISTTSACSSKAGKPAGTLISMGIPTKLAQTAVRISLDDDNDMGQVEQFLTIFKQVYAKTQKVR